MTLARGSEFEAGGSLGLFGADTTDVALEAGGLGAGGFKLRLQLGRARFERSDGLSCFCEVGRALGVRLFGGGVELLELGFGNNLGVDRLFQFARMGVAGLLDFAFALLGRARLKVGQLTAALAHLDTRGLQFAGGDREFFLRCMQLTREVLRSVAVLRLLLLESFLGTLGFVLLESEGGGRLRQLRTQRDHIAIGGFATLLRRLGGCFELALGLAEFALGATGAVLDRDQFAFASGKGGLGFRQLDLGRGQFGGFRRCCLTGAFFLFRQLLFGPDGATFHVDQLGFELNCFGCRSFGRSKVLLQRHLGGRSGREFGGQTTVVGLGCRSNGLGCLSGDLAGQTYPVDHHAFGSSSQSGDVLVFVERLAQHRKRDF